MAKTWLLIPGLTVILAGCGTAATTSSPSSSSMTSHSTPASSTQASGTVTKLIANKSAEMLKASTHSKSSHNEATFTITAYNKNGQPAANQSVTFYIGPMVPLSNHPPTHWYASGTAGAQTYIAHSSHKTNSQGQATVTLYGQPGNTMEMIGAKIGNLSSYSQKAMRSIASLSAWWESPSGSLKAPIGDSVTASPYLEVVSPNTSHTVTISVNSPHGPVANATATLTSPAAKKKNSMGQNSMMSSSGGKTIMTNSSGVAHYQVKSPASGNLALRIVVTHGGQMARIAGGMNSLFMIP